MLEVAAVGNKVGKAKYKKAVPNLRLDLVNAQYDLKAADFPVIIWIAGDDHVAANDMTNRLNEWMDARFVDTRVFAEVTEEEAARPQLWRLWRSLPPKGRMSIFAGGLMRAAIQRANKEIKGSEFNAWIRHLAAMQEALLLDGALILKFYLHTPKKEQVKRLREAEKAPLDGWWVDQRDWALLKDSKAALPYAEKILARTSAPDAPWTIVEATDPRYRDLTVAQNILAALRARLDDNGDGAKKSKKRKKRQSAAEKAYTNIDKPRVLKHVDLSLSYDRDEYRRQLAKQQGKFHKLAMEARKRNVGIALAFEGWDAGGKGGVIRRITTAMEAGDYRVVPTAAPTEQERRFHYLWRFWRDVPPMGKTVIFDRTWYGRVLVERVEGFATQDEWQRAYGEINDFEAQLVERGYYVAKFWLHISPEEQLARFRAREDTPYKQHKITEEDYRNRERWDEYVTAVDQMLLRTSAGEAKWNVIPANDKRYARIATLKAVNRGLAKTLRATK